jgi:transcriptional regulator with XRE-family HTH domain
MLDLAFFICHCRHMKTDLSSRLKAARQMRDLPQGEVASLAGLDPSAISHFELGHRAPSLANLRKVTTALGVSADYLLGLSESMFARRGDALSDRIGRLSNRDRDVVSRLVDSMEVS